MVKRYAVLLHPSSFAAPRVLQPEYRLAPVLAALARVRD